MAAAVWLTPAPAAELPGTKPLTADGDLAAKMVAGMHAYLDRALAENAAKLWDRSRTFPKGDAERAKEIDARRAWLRKVLGAADQRLPPRMEYAGGPDEPSVVFDAPTYTVSAVRWAALPGIDGEGLLFEPKGKAAANVVAVPDPAWTPEVFAGVHPGGKRMTAEEENGRLAKGLGVLPVLQIPRRLAENGCRVVVPVLIDRNDDLSANPKLGRATNQTHREFVHRMAYEMGRTLLGYEVQKVLAAADWLAAKDEAPLAVWGVSEGGLVALLAAQCEPRFKYAVLSGYFANFYEVWKGPLYHNVWDLYTGPSHALVGHLLTDTVMIRHDVHPVGILEPVERPGRKGAAPGGVPGPYPGKSHTYPVGGGDAEARRGHEALVKAAEEKPEPERLFWRVALDSAKDKLAAATAPVDARKTFDPAARHKRQFDQLVAHVQKLWRDSEFVRKEFWKKADATSPEAWEKSCDGYRDYFHTEVIGKLPEPTIPLNPRSRQVYDEKTWTGHEVMLDVYPDVYAYGILLMPKDLKPGEKRPVVVCQHGLEGTPRSTIDPEKRVVYNEFSRKLVELGYIVYAPQNPYYGENEFRQLNRKANPLKLSLFSFIIRQHQRTLDWLETLPNVDPKRIAFYGLSYGGKTAMRVPAVEKRYCLSICSGDFNEWVGKIVSVDLDRGYMWTREYEMYEFDLGHTFNYAEMAYLIAPRPFMVERGHDDGVGTDEMVAYEYAKVRYLYANRLKLPARTAIEFFPGGHQVNAKGTFAFLKQHLGFPK
ncbi:MAG: hypothetical protein C0501_17630 [Isosphaera sp.]|nr:hypothetical protein [Isosphaera sp.]